MSSCGCCVEVPTLQSVYDSETRDYDDDPLTDPSPRDLVFEALTLTENGAGDTPADIFDSYTGAVYNRIWQDFRYRMLGTCDEDMFVRILADRLFAESYAAIAQMEMVDASVSSGYLVVPGKVVESQQHTDTFKRKREDLPDDFSDTYTYPSEKSEDTNDYGTHAVMEMGPNGTVSEALRDAMNALKDPLDDLMRRISGCWLNRW